MNLWGFTLCFITFLFICFLKVAMQESLIKYPHNPHLLVCICFNIFVVKLHKNCSEDSFSGLLITKSKTLYIYDIFKDIFCEFLSDNNEVDVNSLFDENFINSFFPNLNKIDASQVK